MKEFKKAGLGLSDDGPVITLDGKVPKRVKRIAVIVDPEDGLAFVRVVSKEAAGALSTRDYPLDPFAFDVAVKGTSKKPAGKSGGRKTGGDSG